MYSKTSQDAVRDFNKNYLVVSNIDLAFRNNTCNYQYQLVWVVLRDYNRKGVLLNDASVLEACFFISKYGEYVYTHFLWDDDLGNEITGLSCKLKYDLSRRLF